MVISSKKKGKEKSKTRLRWINQSTWVLQLLNLVKQKGMSFDIGTWKKNDDKGQKRKAIDLIFGGLVSGNGLVS